LIGQRATVEEEIAVMQRKGQLGMNAVLSMSLALSRLRAAVDGKHLWQVLREEMKKTMSQVLESYDVPASEKEPLSELTGKLRALAPRLAEKNTKLTGLFRNAMPVYQPLESAVNTGVPNDRLV